MPWGSEFVSKILKHLANEIYYFLTWFCRNWSLGSLALVMAEKFIKNFQDNFKSAAIITPW